MLGGAYRSWRYPLSFSSTYFVVSGEMSLASSFVNSTYDSGGGFSGSGCVGCACSPGTSDGGAGTSRTPNSGLPVSRWNT